MTQQRLESLKRATLAHASRIAREVWFSLVSTARIIAELSLYRPRMPTLQRRKLIILGAGPSLTQSLDEVELDRLRDFEFMSVNNYYKASSFRELRPGFHVVADPTYWDDSSYGEYTAPLVAALLSADWDIRLFLPLRSRHSRLHRALIESKIRFTFYRTTPIRGFPLLEYFAFKLMFGMPRAQNVLIAALSIGLWLDFDTICLIGADHSWHQEIELSPANILMVRQLHSYDGAVERRPFLKPSGVVKALSKQEVSRHDVFTVKEIFLAWAAMHESYEQLSKIAERKGAKIFNSSALTFIDAFDRLAFADFVAPTNTH
jgi:hypothetical protein